MRGLLEDVIRSTPIYSMLRARRQKRELVSWERRGKTLPLPHIVKQRAIRELAEKHGLTIFVETGTYYGDMVEAMKNHFCELFSIELSGELYEKARRRFAGDNRITIIRGDSGIELGKLMGKIDRPALFWLDGHYSAGVTARGEKDTPIYEELTHIFASQQLGHVVVIDDARCFGVDPGYPGVEELGAFIRSRRPDASIEFQSDSIRVVL